MNGCGTRLSRHLADRPNHYRVASQGAGVRQKAPTAQLLLCTAARFRNLWIAMNRLRRKSWVKVGATLGALAFCLQAMLSSTLLLANANPTDPANFLGAHALCAAGGSGSTHPSDPAPGAPAAPANDHLCFCCLWHPLPVIAPQAALTPHPGYYAALAPGLREVPSLVAVPRSGPANARAPPALA
jgi:hypothetical protein